jgi:hypothetical protein
MDRVRGAFRVSWPKERYDEQAGVSLVFQIEEGTEKSLRDVLVRGNANTRDHVIRRKVRAMPGERVAQREVAHLGLVGRQGGDGRRGRRDALAEQATDDPVAAFHGTGAQARRIRGEKNGHR